MAVNSTVRFRRRQITTVMNIVRAVRKSESGHPSQAHTITATTCSAANPWMIQRVQERLFREFNMDVITTVPNVSYKVFTTKGEVVDVHNPSGLPAQTLIDHIEEPYIRAQIISKSDFYGPIMKLCMDKRGTLIGQHYITTDRVELNYDLPLSEVVFDFYDKLKSISKGYASFDYHVTDFRPARLVKLDILLNGDPADALSTLIHEDHAYDFGRKICLKLKEPRPL